MTKRLLDFQADTGVARYFHYDHDRNEVVEEAVQDVERFTEANRRQHNEHSGKLNGPDELGVKVATIPMVILEKLQRDGILHDPVAFKRWLNDSDNAAFRTRPGVI